MVPMKILPLKQNISYHSKHPQTYTLLNYFQLYKRKRASVSLKANPIGWNLATIFKESDAPRKKNDAY